MYNKRKKDFPGRTTVGQWLLALLGAFGAGFVFSLPICSASGNNNIICSTVNIVNPLSIDPISFDSSSVQDIEPLLIDTEATGTSQNETYTLNLQVGEVVVGDAHDVENRGFDGCVVFWKRGPSEITFNVTDGKWYLYTQVNTEDEFRNLIEDRYRFLDAHWFCKDAELRGDAIHIVELGNPN